MFLRNISVKNYGPIADLSYTFRFDEAGNPINNDPEFDSFSFEGFRSTLDMIKTIVQDAEGN